VVLELAAEAGPGSFREGKNQHPRDLAVEPLDDLDPGAMTLAFAQLAGDPADQCIAFAFGCRNRQQPGGFEYHGHMLVMKKQGRAGWFGGDWSSHWSGRCGTRPALRFFRGQFNPVTWSQTHGGVPRHAAVNPNLAATDEAPRMEGRDPKPRMHRTGKPARLLGQPVIDGEAADRFA
jgi:hypothetical protein